jgi:formate dehydrogenase major subunit
MVSLTINGKKVEVPDGTTVLRAAESAGITIPTLCDHKHLLPYGGCRLCLVEVEGARTLQPSCTLPVSNNMVVKTDTDKVREARKFVLTLLFSERNHFCMYCQVSGGDCELQNAAYGEGMTNWPLQPNWKGFPVDASHPYFVLEHNRCILCRRCVRACAELVGNFTLGIEERGSNSVLVADLGTPLGESTCISCGTCVQVCPTGALIDRQSAYQGREKDAQKIKTTCIGCSVGCGIEAIVRNNHLMRIEGDWDAPVNEGLLCEVGRFRPISEQHERILTPLVRKDGALKAATWEEALKALAAKMKPLAGKNGNGVAALVSTRLPAEALAIFKEVFADQMQSQMVTSIEEGVPTAVQSEVARELGKTFEGKLDELNKTDAVLTFGVDLVGDHQVAGFFIKRAVPKGIKLVVADAVENKLNPIADIALKFKADSDYDLVMGLMAAVNELGNAKAKPGKNYDLSKYSPDAVSKTCGVSAEAIRAAAKLLVEAKSPAFVYGNGLNLSKDSKETMKALIELGRMVGAIDDKHSALISIKGKANSLASALMGLDKPFEINKQQAVFLALGDDIPSQRLMQKLEKAPFLAVMASYTSPATAKADVVLPVEMWTEQEGHYLNLDGRLQEAHKVVAAPEGVLSNVDALQKVSEALGYKSKADWKKALKSGTAAVLIA